MNKTKCNTGSFDELDAMQEVNFESGHEDEETNIKSIPLN